MESTGIYHKNLLNFLKSRNYNVIVIDPYKMWRFFRFINPKPTTTDKKSAETIAEFLESNKDNLQNNPNLPTDQKCSLRYLVRKQEQITKDIAKTKTEIKRLLTLLFPELERKFAPFNTQILQILEKFPSANSIRNYPKEDFLKSFKLRENSNISLKEIYKLAENSISFCYPLYEEMLKLGIKRLRRLQEERRKISYLIEEVAERYFKREIEILTSIPGIGKSSAIYFMAEIIDIKRFANKRKLIGFCGLDPVIKQSGGYKARFRISKRGNAHARRIAFIMANCVKRESPYFRKYYLKKRGGGNCYLYKTPQNHLCFAL
jgi:transposase